MCSSTYNCTRYFTNNKVDLTGYGFKIEFAQNTTSYIELPLQALMRQNGTEEVEHCVILVTNLIN